MKDHWPEYKTQFQITFEESIRYVLGREPIPEEVELFKTQGIYAWMQKYGKVYEGENETKQVEIFKETTEEV